MRVVLAALSALVLTACNMVVSHEPLFTKADEAKAAPFRDGWWVNPKPGCAFDENGDARDWPECAQSQLLRRGQQVDVDDPADSVDLILAAGDPQIMQLAVKQKGVSLYAYAGVRPLKRDSKGRLIEARTWIVQCGPPPPKVQEPKGFVDFATLRPLPGMTVDKEMGSCWTDKAEAVRGAATASEAWDEDKAVIRWVREVRAGEETPRPKPEGETKAPD